MYLFAVVGLVLGNLFLEDAVVGRETEVKEENYQFGSFQRYDFDSCEVVLLKNTSGFYGAVTVDYFDVN